MKKMRRIFTFVLTVVLLLSAACTSAFAAEKESYTYTVTFYAGNQGSFASGAGISVNSGSAAVSVTADKIVVSGLKYGDVVGLNAQASVSLSNDSKYYIRGVRLSGRDNDTVAASAFRVTEDMDFVVAYGIRGNQVAYTVNYQDANGNSLAPSESFYGNIGDKPVIAYKYIEGYAPQALGLTKTLSADASQNMFTFVYELMPTPTVVPGESDNEDADTPEEGEEGTGENNEDAQEGTEEPGVDQESETSGEVSGEGETEGSEETQETTADIIDLDDEEVPLADEAPDADKQDSSMGIYVGMSAVGVLALIAIVFVVIFKRRSFK